ncbi:protein translocase subunit SecD [Calycomorphotria hydatis]|nr:protein translocase subunit SecD [Calycomorphotria hydatis]
MELPLLWAQAVEAAPVEAGNTIPGWVTLLVVLSVFVLPFLIGAGLGRLLKVEDLSFKMGLVLFAAAMGLTPFLWNMIQGNAQGMTAGESLKSSIRLGIDLAGGTNLVYQVVETKEKPINDQVMDRMVGAVGKRINPSGTEEVTVRRVGRDRLEVIVPGADQDKVEKTKEGIINSGQLEFALLANEIDHKDIIDQAREFDGKQRDLYVNGQIKAAWKSVGRDANGKLKDVYPSTNSSGIPDRTAVRYVDETGTIVEEPGDREPDLDRQVLVVFEQPDRRVTGSYLRSAYPSRDDSGLPAVGFAFNNRGAYLFGELTAANRPSADGFARRLAVVLNDKIESAPYLNTVITGSGIITGRFTQSEVSSLVDILNAGALEVPINPTPVSEFTISPLLGEDTVRKAVSAMLWAGIIVLIFMAAYYFVAGLIADFCLVLNIVLVMGAMSFIDATFTLPGLAGIVLTIGMAVDANVLIFERIREESSRGSSLRMAIQNGFDKALSTIVDANVTTLITSVILFLIGTDQVKGFAVTLFIGIVTSMFTALYFGRLMFDLLERKRWIRSLKMNSIIGSTHVQFLSGVKIAVAISLVFIAIGLGVFFSRGAKMLDIDFRGGTMVTFELTEATDSSKVKAALESIPEFAGDISVERLEISDDSGDGTGRRFRMRTTLKDADSSKQTEDGKPAEETANVDQLIVKAFENSDLSVRLITIDFTEPTAASEDLSVPVEGFDANNATVSTIKLGGDEELTASTISRYVSTELEKIKEGDANRYDDASKLLYVEGKSGSGLDKAENEVRTFSEMELVASGQIEQADLNAALTAVQQHLATQPVFDEVNSFDSAVATEMQQSAILAILASLVAIVAYLWFRFQRVMFGLAAVVALVHDVSAVLGCVALGAAIAAATGTSILGLEEFKINLPMIAAFLTIIGYSLNDTIVVFDRIREVRGRNPDLTASMINTSLNQTLSRTLLTSVTTLIVVLILYIFGGEGIHGFAYCLVCGILVGTYSSIFIASPALLWLMNRTKQSEKATSKPSQETVTA